MSEPANSLEPRLPPRSVFRDFSLSAVVAGFIAVLVGFTSSAAIVFQAAETLGATQAQIASWLWALGLGMAITCMAPSLLLRMPVVTAWSTPGAATLMAVGPGLPMGEVIGAFVMAALLTALVGYTGWFARALRHIPMSLAYGMLAGVLVGFGFDAFAAVQLQPLMVLLMLGCYLLGRLWFARYAVPVTFALGVAVAVAGGQMQGAQVPWQWPAPVFTMPVLSFSALFSVALPLFIVTMSSQNIPGVAVARASGFALPLSPVIGFIGTCNLLLAPFGAFAMNLAAISGAVCMGREAHEQPERRYVAAIAAGFFYLVLGLLGAVVVAWFAAFPRELIVAIAGIALLGTLASSLHGALQDEAAREPALITFLVTASGLTLAGIGAAFWGLLAGGIAMLVLHRRR